MGWLFQASYFYDHADAVEKQIPQPVGGRQRTHELPQMNSKPLVWLEGVSS